MSRVDGGVGRNGLRLSEALLKSFLKAKVIDLSKKMSFSLHTGVSLKKFIQAAIPCDLPLVVDPLRYFNKIFAQV